MSAKSKLNNNEIDLITELGLNPETDSESLKKQLLEILDKNENLDEGLEIQNTEKFANWQFKIFLGSVGGRFFGMDRDKNWERVWTGMSQMFNPFTLSQKDFSGKISPSEQRLIDFMNQKYQTDISKEFFNSEQEIQPETIKIDSKTQIITKITDFLQELADLNYKEEKFDEVIIPIRPVYENLEADREKNDLPLFATMGINKNDTICLINFRSDRMKQFAQMFCDLNTEFDLNLNILALNDYGDGNSVEIENEKLKVENKKGYYPIFKSQAVQVTLAEVISKMEKNQLHIAETEKYNHVTYFLNGGQDKKWDGEEWIVIPSNKVNGHNEKPEMKAKEVTDKLLEVLGGEELENNNPFLNQSNKSVFEKNPFLKGSSREALGISDQNLDVNSQTISQIQIQKANIEDLDEIIQIQKDCYLADYGQDGLEKAPWEIIRADKVKWLQFDKNKFLIAVENKEIIASIALIDQDSNYKLVSFFVKPQRQNQGIGTFLIQSLLSQIKEAKDIILKTNNAQKFYEKFGFEDLGNGEMVLRKEKLHLKLEFIYQQDKTTQNLEFKDRPTTKSIIYNPKTNKYLWHQNVNNLFIDTNFALIGGGIKQNETAEEGLFRKLKIEAGLDKNELESINLLGKTNLKYEFVVDKRWHANIVVGNLETDKNFNINQLNYIFYIETLSEKTDVEEDSCISKWLSKEEILADENSLSLEARFLLENLDKLKKESEEVENNAVFLNQSNKLVFEKNPFLKGSEQSEGGFLINQIQIPYNPELKEKASQMRQNMTKAESLVWNMILKDDQTGYRFIRQKPLLNYIVDFYCHKLGLIIEIDGESHNYQLDYDAERSQKLAEYNLQVLRINNSDIYSNLEGAKLHIKEVIKEIENSKIHSKGNLEVNKIPQNHIQQAVKKSEGDKIPQNLKILTPLKRGDDVQNIQSYASKRGDDTGNSWSGTTSNNFITTEVEPNLYQIKTLETYEKFGLEYIKVSGDEFIDQNGDLIVDKKMKVWLEQALNKLKPEAKILEIGSGSSADSDYMESKGFTVYRTDAAESFIKYQQNLGKKITKLNLLEDFELTDKYDLIYASKVLGHFTKRQVREILLKLKNNLTASGLLAINVKLGTKPAKFNDYLDIGGELYKDFWNEEGFEKVLAELDFEIKYAQKSDSDVWLNLILSQKKQYDYIIVNYANPDMVGHTGDIPASIASMEFLDEQLGRLIETVERGGHEMIIIADHGNIEFVGEFVKNGQKLTDTEHNANPVPCVFVGNGWKVGDQTKLENQKIKLLENLTNLKTKGFCSPDVDLVAKVLSQQNQVNLENPENWLTKEQIENIRPQLSLWYSGVLLLGLGE